MLLFFTKSKDFGSNLKQETSLIISTLCFIEKFITNDFLVSIDNKVFGNFFLNFSNNLYTLCNSFFGDITLDPGLVDYPPISIISAPDFFKLSILLIAFL